MARLQLRDLGGVDVDDDDVITAVREARGCDRPHITHADDGDLHETPLTEPMSGGAVIGHQGSSTFRASPAVGQSPPRAGGNEDRELPIGHTTVIRRYTPRSSVIVSLYVEAY